MAFGARKPTMKVGIKGGGMKSAAKMPKMAAAPVMDNDADDAGGMPSAPPPFRRGGKVGGKARGKC